MQKHVAIIIPGLGELERFPFLTSHWRKSGIEPLPLRLHWHNGEHFDEKLSKILNTVDEQRALGNKVSLVGCSAGASAALNAFAARKDEVNKVISVCGWLRVGKDEQRLKKWTRLSESFIESVTRSDEAQAQLSAED